MNSVHELPKALKPNGNKNETNLKKHINSEHEFEPPDDLKKHEDLTNKNLFSNNQIKIQNCYKCKMCNVKCENESTLKKHIKHEPPDDLSDPEYKANDEKVKLMKDSEEMRYDCYKCGMC